MSTHSDNLSPADRCPECGAPVGEVGSADCGRCRSRAEAASRTTSKPPYPPLPALPPPLPVIEPERFTYTLGTLMLAMTLVAVLCGLSVHWPGLGIPLAILAVPAWIRASRSLSINPKTSVNPTLGDKFEKFFLSLGVVILISLASGVAGFTACTIVFFTGFQSGPGSPSWDNSLAWGSWIGGGAFVAMFVYLSMQFWPKRKWRR